MEGLLDQYLTSIAATHHDAQAVDPELPLLLSAALVSLLRVHPALADHVGYLGYVPKLVAAVAYEGRRETMASGEVKNENYAGGTYESEDGSTQANVQTPQERVRLSCLRVLHQLAASTTCAEAMAATSVGTPQVCLDLSVHNFTKFTTYMYVLDYFRFLVAYFHCLVAVRVLTYEIFGRNQEFNKRWDLLPLTFVISFARLFRF